MAEPDFDIEHYTEELTRTRGDRVSKTLYPTAGRTCAIVYIEASGGLGAINTKLNEIAALADASHKYVWEANVLDETVRPAVNVRVVVFNNAPPACPGAIR